MKEKLYAYRIAKRAITIMDVPEKYREGVMAILGESDRERCGKMLARITS